MEELRESAKFITTGTRSQSAVAARKRSRSSIHFHFD
jgi:hypothetical protein